MTKVRKISDKYTLAQAYDDAFEKLIFTKRQRFVRALKKIFGVRPAGQITAPWLPSVDGENPEWRLTNYTVFGPGAGLYNFDSVSLTSHRPARSELCPRSSGIAAGGSSEWADWGP